MKIAIYIKHCVKIKLRHLQSALKRDNNHMYINHAQK